MSNVIFTYNEEAALTAGQGGFINETGAHIITITTDVKSNILASVFRKMTERKTNLAQMSFTP